MPNTAITYKPRGIPTTKTLNLGTTPALKRFEGFPITDRRSSISRSGGIAVTVIHDTHHEFDCEMEAIHPNSDQALFRSIVAWLSEAQAGVEFTFALDDTKDSDTTTTALVAHGDVIIPIVSSTGMSADDWMFFEDKDDPTQFVYVRINTVDSGVQVTLHDSPEAQYPSGSVFRHKDFFPKCLLLKSKFEERQGGKGSDIWDLRFRFRTIR